MVSGNLSTVAKLHPAHGAVAGGEWKVSGEIPVTFTKQRGMEKVKFVMYELDKE